MMHCEYVGHFALDNICAWENKCCNKFVHNLGIV